jgi:hypothetical protein
MPGNSMRFHGIFMRISWENPAHPGSPWAIMGEFMRISWDSMRFSMRILRGRNLMEFDF